MSGLPVVGKAWESLKSRQDRNRAWHLGIGFARRLWINDCTAPEDRIKISARFEAFKSMEGIFVPLMVKVINGELTATRRKQRI